MAAPSAAMREKITFDPNVPVEVSLESEGQEQANRAGDIEYRYFLRGNRIMWVPEDAHHHIERLMAGDNPHNSYIELSITKHKSGRQTTWNITRHTGNDTNYGYGKPSPTTPLPAPPRQEPPALLPSPQQQLPASQAAQQPFSTSLYTCLCAAIRVVAMAESFAKEVGRPVAFDTQDIRALGTTLFINSTGGGR